MNSVLANSDPIDVRCVIFADAEDADCGEMQRKLEAYNHVLDQEMTGVRGAAGHYGAGNNSAGSGGNGGVGGHRRQQQFVIHCKSVTTKRIALCFFFLLVLGPNDRKMADVMSGERSIAN